MDTMAGLEALQDPGWYAATMLALEISHAIVGPYAMVTAVPDPDGSIRRSNGQDGSQPAILISIEMDGAGAAIAVPYQTESLVGLRAVLTQVAARLAGEAIAKRSKLVVPKKTLVVPGA